MDKGEHLAVSKKKVSMEKQQKQNNFKKSPSGYLY